MTRFVAQPGSKVSIKGGNDIHEFDIQGKEIQGEAEFGTSFPAAAPPAAKAGNIPARIEGFIPVRSLHYGATVMDKMLYHHLKEQANPRISFRFSKLTLKEASSTNGAPYVFEARGELGVAGVTNQISIPIQILAVDGNRLKLSANTSAKMTDFGITPPRFETGNHPIKYRDKVEVSIEWSVARESEAAGKDKP